MRQFSLLYSSAKPQKSGSGGNHCLRIIRRGVKYCSVRFLVITLSVCLSVCLSLCSSISVCLLAYLRNHSAELRLIFVYVARWSISVLFWWRCDTLCINFRLYRWRRVFLHSVLYDSSCIFISGKTVHVVQRKQLHRFQRNFAEQRSESCSPVCYLISLSNLWKSH